MLCSIFQPRGWGVCAGRPTSSQEREVGTLPKGQAFVRCLVWGCSVSECWILKSEHAGTEDIERAPHLYFLALQHRRTSAFPVKKRKGGGDVVEIKMEWCREIRNALEA